MATPIRMPKLGMTMSEGKVVDWPVPLGGWVEKDQIVVVIESEKAEAEIEATGAGHFRHVYVEIGETAPCGALLGALTETPDEPFDVEDFRRENDLADVAQAAPPRAAPLVPAPSSRPSRERGPRVPVAPAARALARKLGIDPTQMRGTGPGGRVTKADVEAGAAAGAGLVAASGGVRLEVPSAGRGEPLLLLPGFGTDVSSFSFQTAVLVERQRVLAVNPRGVGASQAPDLDAYEVTTAAADVAALAPGPSHLIGASLGAAVALEVALERPDLVRSLVLITPFLEATARLRAVLTAWCRIAGETSPENLAHALLPWLFSEGFLADQKARERTLRGLAASVARVPVSTLERTAAGLLSWSGSRRDALGAIEVPTLVVGAGADLLAPDAELVGRAIPNAETRVVPDAGHAVAIEAREGVNQAIVAHLHSAASA